uniref:Cobyrinate a,c-diamide synthase n=1 Tax=Cyanothece sp. (strain PCC 7425 / ATCC 29141) TaxID=395961 RepID=B8HLW9_CYAP4
MALIVAGERSGVGKTTVTLALLAALARRGMAVQSFKVGPDYIDPMFHRRITGRPCYNLDPVLTSPAYVQRSFFTHTQPVSYALVEGVMGLFDGVGSGEEGSTAHLARLLNVPILLVVDAARLSGSIAALVQGYRNFDPRLHFAGVVLNRVGSDRHAEILTAALEPLGLPLLGLLRRDTQIQIPDRHLGLVPVEELTQLPQLFDQLAHLGEQGFAWNQLLPLLQTRSTSVEARPPCPAVNSPQPRVPIAIARDRAFNFYYPENLDCLSQWGAELVDWSPLADPQLPSGVRGLYFGGGFPEVFAAELAANQSARATMFQALQAGIPTYAECGGLMYLCSHLQTLAGEVFPMVGFLPATVEMSARLTLGYRQAIALQESCLVPAGACVTGHEFHHSRLRQPPPSPLYDLCPYSSLLNKLSSKKLPPTPEGWRIKHLHASYLHLHWGDRPLLPQRFLQHCRHWQPD